MVLTWRAAALAALGVLPLALWPTLGTVLAWAAVVAVVAAVDAALAASPREVAVARAVPPSVRLTEATRSSLTVTNTSRRRLRGVVRDAWQPSAGATRNRHAVDLPAG